MTGISHRRPGWLLAGTALTAIALSLPAAAQRPDPATAATRPAGRAFDIPAQPLASALNAYGRQSGLQITAEAGVVAGLSSQPVSGSFTAEEALHRLLAGTGVRWHVTGDGTVVLTRPPAAPSGALDVPEVNVTAGRLRSFSPVRGYAAMIGGAGMRTDTPLLETPQSVSIVTADQIRATDSSSVTEALAYTPGLAAQASTYSRMADDLMIRGFNVADGYSGILRDGMRLGPNVYGTVQEPYGLERVEVVRGAASVLYGQLTPGGLVNTVSKRPTDEPLHELNIGYGSYNRRFLSGDFGGRLTEDGTVTYRLTGLWRDSDSWIDHVEDNRRYIAPAITWRPTQDTSLTLLASYQRTETQFSPPMPFTALSSGAVPRDFFNGEPGFDRFQVDAYTAGYLLEHAFSDRVTFRSSARYFTSVGRWDYLTFVSLAPNGNVTRGVSQREESSTGFVADNSLELRFDTGPASHTVLAGVDYFTLRYNSHRYTTGTAFPINVNNPVYGRLPIVNRAIDRGSRVSGDQVGLYAQDQIRLFDRLVLTIGGRYDWAGRETEVFRTGQRASQDDSAFTGRVGLVYLFENGFAPYVSFSQSFAPNIGSDRNGSAFTPTRGTQYEAGLRYQPPGTSLIFSAAAYQLTQRDALVTDPVDANYQIQTGEVRSRGFELEARGDIGPFGFVASYSYTDARMTETTVAAQRGQRVALVPYNTAALWGDVRLDGIGLPGLKIGGGVRYVGATNVPGFSRDVPSYVVADAMLRYDLDHLAPSLRGTSITINAHNLFGEKYFTCAGDSSGCRYGAPRTVLATLSYRW